MVDWIESTWSRSPNWLRWPAVVLLAVFLHSVLTSIGERHFLHSVFEAFMATVLRYGAMALGIGGGLVVGRWLYRRTNNALIGLGIGVFLGLTLIVLGSSFVRDIPGVGDRIRAMDEDPCYIDWDGRSNPVVC